MVWSSSNEEVATVANGLVTAIAPGDVTIRAEAADGYGAADSVNITVSEHPDPEDMSLLADGQEIIGSTYTLEKDDTVAITAILSPETALQDVTFTYVENAESIVYNYERYIYLDEASGRLASSGTCPGEEYLWVYDSVTSTYPYRSATLGRFTDRGETGNGSLVNRNYSIEGVSGSFSYWYNEQSEYTLQDPAIELSEDGRMTGLTQGTATVRVTSAVKPEIQQLLTVRVIVSAQRIEVTQSADTLELGETMQLSARVIPDNADNQTIQWRSSDDSRATVSSAGLVTAVSRGQVVIYASTANGASGRAVLEVVEPITVTFDANGGECEETSRAAYAGKSIGELPEPSRAYYDFGGWWTKNAGGVPAVESYDQDVTLYAHWIPHTFTVSYDPNDGEVSVTSKTCTVGQPLGALAVPTRVGYTLSGWYCLNYDRIVVADFVPETDDDLVLQARWYANSYSVTLNANGGSCSMSSITVYYNYVVGTLPSATRPGYSFSGWYTEGGTKITAATIYTNLSDMVLYAHWSVNRYSVSFNANGGSIVETKTGDYGSDFLLPGSTKTGYRLLGWSNGAVTLGVATSYTIAGDIQLTAVWEANTYTLTLDANGGSCTTASKSVTYNSTVGALTTPTRTGYDFEGWYTADGTQYTAYSTYVTDGNMTLYARWTAKPYRLIFNANGGYCASAYRSVTYNGTVGALPTPTRDYYTFDGWYTDDGKRYTATTYTTAGDLTLTAQWTAKDYGAWSSWSTTVVYSDSTRDVETKVVTTYQKKTIYHYERWCYKGTSDYYTTPNEPNVTAANKVHQYLTIDTVLGTAVTTLADGTVYKTKTGITSELAYDGSKYGTSGVLYPADYAGRTHNHSWWYNLWTSQEDDTSKPIYTTYYRYRDRAK